VGLCCVAHGLNLNFCDCVTSINVGEPFPLGKRSLPLGHWVRPLLDHWSYTTYRIAALSFSLSFYTIDSTIAQACADEDKAEHPTTTLLSWECELRSDVAAPFTSWVGSVRVLAAPAAAAIGAGPSSSRTTVLRSFLPRLCNCSVPQGSPPTTSRTTMLWTRRRLTNIAGHNNNKPQSQSQPHPSYPPPNGSATGRRAEL
jgi:hypothetical protein